MNLADSTKCLLSWLYQTCTLGRTPNSKDTQQLDTEIHNCIKYSYDWKEVTNQTKEELLTYDPSNLVQNQPENQMDILLVGGAYETLQCTNEQILPWITEGKDNIEN